MLLEEYYYARDETLMKKVKHDGKRESSSAARNAVLVRTGEMTVGKKVEMF